MSDLVKCVTPVGELHYVNISGQGKQNYNEDGYEYVASIRLSGEKAEKLIADFDAIAETMPAGMTLKSCGYTEVVKDSEGKLRVPTKNKPKTDDEEGTGVYNFTFKTNVTYGDGRPKKITVYNDGKKSPNGKPQIVNLGDRKIGNGSIGAISGVLKGSPYKKEFSVSAYLNSIQIVKFEEYIGDAGFDAQDDGEFDGAFEDEESGFESVPEEQGESTKEEKAKPRL